MVDQNNYIVIMLESLQKKASLLETLSLKCDMQSDIVSQKEISWSDFDSNITEKQSMIDELMQLDEGFEKVYARVKLEISENKEKYSNEITKMQEFIMLITDLSVHIQAKEERNRKLVEKSILLLRQDIKKSRTSVKAASDYYKSMSKVNYIDPQFMDRKK
jgi:hypothetical protein